MLGSLLISALLCVSSVSAPRVQARSKTVHVKSYNTKAGKHVQAYKRAKPR
ncbi:MAG: hypothetical protein QM723_19205 [Myxococcaceae bacterium]